MSHSTTVIAISMILLGGGCSDDPAAWCDAQGEPDTACAGPQCVAALVVDYKRLEPRGFRIFALSGEWIDRQTAESIAHDHVVDQLGAGEPDVSDCVRADDFYHCVLPYRETGDQYLVVVHANSGALLFAGLEIWADIDKRGYDFPLHDGFSDSAAIGCAPTAAEPERRRLVPTNPLMGQAIPSTPKEALDVARRTNVLGRFVDGWSYNALVINHGPAIGELDVESADWYVWVQRHPSQ